MTALNADPKFNPNVSPDLYASAEKNGRVKFIYCGGETLNTPYKSGNTAAAEGFAISVGSSVYNTIVYFAISDTKIYINKRNHNGWSEGWKSI